MQISQIVEAARRFPMMAMRQVVIIKEAQEIADIVHDVELLLSQTDGRITGEQIRAIIVLAQMNLHIWHNESNYRKGIKDGNNLELTHGLNGIRNVAKNKIQEVMGGRKDYKIPIRPDHGHKMLDDLNKTSGV